MEAPASAYANGGILRKCRDHLLGNSGSGSVSEKRDEKGCETPLNGSWGCTRGYRWEGCNQGYKWCWTAANYDNEPWARCTRARTADSTT
ncbi:hypothetical protein NHJ13734_006325 [Beauveria thailandica]